MFAKKTRSPHREGGLEEIRDRGESLGIRPRLDPCLKTNPKRPVHTVQSYSDRGRTLVSLQRRSARSKPWSGRGLDPSSEGLHRRPWSGRGSAARGLRCSRARSFLGSHRARHRARQSRCGARRFVVAHDAATAIGHAAFVAAAGLDDDTPISSGTLSERRPHRPGAHDLGKRRIPKRPPPDPSLSNPGPKPPQPVPRQMFQEPEMRPAHGFHGGRVRVAADPTSAGGSRGRQRTQGLRGVSTPPPARARRPAPLAAPNRRFDRHPTPASFRHGSASSNATSCGPPEASRRGAFGSGHSGRAIRGPPSARAADLPHQSPSP